MTPALSDRLQWHPPFHGGLCYRIVYYLYIFIFDGRTAALSLEFPGYFRFWARLMSFNWFPSRLVYDRALVSGQDLAVSWFSVFGFRFSGTCRPLVSSFSRRPQKPKAYWILHTFAVPKHVNKKPQIQQNIQPTHFPSEENVARGRIVFDK